MAHKAPRRRKGSEGGNLGYEQRATCQQLPVCGPYRGIVGEVLFLPVSWARSPRMPSVDCGAEGRLSHFQHNGAFVRPITWIDQSSGPKTCHLVPTA